MRWKSNLGWLSLGLSLCCTAVFFSLPFSDFPLGAKAAGMTAATVTGKILFAISVYFLGKPVIEALKNRLRFWK